MTYEEIMEKLKEYGDWCKCVVKISLIHNFEDTTTTTNIKHPKSKTFHLIRRNPVSYKYIDSHFEFVYFDYNDKLRKVDKYMQFDKAYPPKLMNSINRYIDSIIDRSCITNPDTTIIDKDHPIIQLMGYKSHKIVTFINKYKDGTPLENILNDYSNSIGWIKPVSKTIQDLVFFDGAFYVFNTYAGSPSKNPKVFDYIRLTIPVMKKSRDYDKCISCIKDNIKSIHNLIYNLLYCQMKKKELPMSILDFKNSKMVLTRDFDIVFTVSVKELSNEE